MALIDHILIILICENNIRSDSISRFTDDVKKRHILNLGIYYYMKLLYKYIKAFKVERELLYKELELFNNQILFMKKNDSIFFKKKVKKIFKNIIADDKTSASLKRYLKKIIKYKRNNWTKKSKKKK